MNGFSYKMTAAVSQKDNRNISVSSIIRVALPGFPGYSHKLGGKV